MAKQTVQIDEVTTIRTGVSFREKLVDDPLGNGLVLDSRAINKDREIVTDELIRRPMTEQLYKKTVSNGSILVCAKGPRNMAIGVKNVDFALVPTNYFLVIEKLDECILPEYLVAYLNLTSTQADLKDKSIGSLIKNLSKKSFQTLQIVIPDLEIQKTIVTNSKYMHEEVSVLENLAVKKKLLWEYQIGSLLNA